MALDLVTGDQRPDGAVIGAEMMPRFLIEWSVYLRETLYQWRSSLYDRRRRIEYEAVMKFYKRDDS